MVKIMDKKCNGLIYKVEKGDTLYRISRKYGVKLIDLMKENPYVDVYNLQIGDELCVPTVGNDDYYIKDDETFKQIVKKLNIDIETLFERNKHLYDVNIPKGTVINKSIK